MDQGEAALRRFGRDFATPCPLFVQPSNKSVAPEELSVSVQFGYVNARDSGGRGDLSLWLTERSWFALADSENSGAAAERQRADGSEGSGPTRCHSGARAALLFKLPLYRSLG